LPVAGFEAEDGEIGGARFGFDAVENGSRDALAADGGRTYMCLTSAKPPQRTTPPVGKGRTNLPVPITSFIDAKVNSQRFGMPYRRPPGDSHRSRWRWQDTAV